MSHTIRTASLVIIGNEILSGRTQDKNINFIACGLAEKGISLKEVRVIPDDKNTIITTVNTLRAMFDYVFTTGGIGPTHDDITAESIAEAFGTELERFPEAVEYLLTVYKPDELNEARLKMADIPKGATLVANDVSAAPGFQIENVYVFAGVPRIMQSMFNSIKDTLQGGSITLSRSVDVFLPESKIAGRLANIQHIYPDVEIGSYPFKREDTFGTSLVMRHPDAELLHKVHEEVKAFCLELGGKIDTMDT